MCTVEARAIKDRCPTLLSTFQEVFHVYGMANSVRVANEDHLLDGRDDHDSRSSTAPVEGGVGRDADEFNARRFIRKPGEPRPNPVAFRGSGGGTTLCPGRHFATVEISLFTAMLLLGLDILPAGGGEWLKPSTEKSSHAEAMEQPDHDIQVEIHPRPGAQRWRISFEGAGEAALIAEDL
ncbi:Cytochrome P450 714A1 [Madurella mycetomatis]|uniref:Cytochrome P450 714A1 n=1 Tax=Madurella mycetomatis TaxID=100816 RepID=A0A175VXP9_9PEZI|nr:Cytochrome P450 714A1 [Madurella mycetomatis]